MTTIVHRLHVNHPTHMHTHTDTDIDESYFFVQNFHPIYSHVATGNMSTVNTNFINYTQFMLRHIQVINFLLVESVNLETLNECIKS